MSSTVFKRVSDRGKPITREGPASLCIDGRVACPFSPVGTVDAGRCYGCTRVQEIGIDDATGRMWVRCQP